MEERIIELERKIDQMYSSVEKLRKYFLVTVWVTVIGFILPLILLAVVVPFFLSSYLGSFADLL